MFIISIVAATLLSGALGSYDSLAKCLYYEEVANSQETKWTSANCNEDGGSAVQGLTVDAVCANVADVCKLKTDQTSCSQAGCTWSSNVCKWNTEDGCVSRTTEADCGNTRCQWDAATSTCGWNRDATNNVCLHPPSGHTTLPDATRNCAAILKGKCPPAWEVPTGCCLEEHSKYEVLLESTPGFVCCNAPCTSLEASHTANTQVHLFALTEVTTGTGLVVQNQTVCNGNMGSTLCAPGMRSYFGAQNRVRGGGLMDRNMQMSTMGMFGGRPMFGGRVVGGYGTAGLPGLGFMNEVDLDNEESKEGHVEEISMDDFMETLIEALDTDADVFESDRQITSDPWFGKQKFSLGPNGIKLGKPMDIFNDIYGNPGFGMPGGVGAFGPWGGRGPFGPMGKMGPYGRGGYGGGFGSPYGMGGYGGGYGGYGMSYGSPYGFSNYGPRPHGQPQGYGQQPPAYGQQPPVYGQQPPVYGQQPPAPTDTAEADGQAQQQQPAGYQPPAQPAYPQQPAYAQPPAYQQPAYPQQPLGYPQQAAYPQQQAYQPPAYAQQSPYPAAPAS